LRIAAEEMLTPRKDAAEASTPGRIVIEEEIDGGASNEEIVDIIRDEMRNVGATVLPSQLVTVNDTLPTGLTATGFPGSPANGWTCSLSPLKCTRTSTLAALASFPDIQMTVNVASNAPSQSSNTASLVITGDTNASNNTSIDPTTVLQVADLSITNTDNVTTVVPGNPVTYTIVASNTGPSSPGCSVATA